MRCLVVAAHPLGDSLCAGTAAKAAAALEDGGHEVQVEDLYESGFSPALTSGERRSYYRPPFDDSAVRPQIERLLSAEGLVLVFPTWWFGMPAMLKGWFDRVWAPGVAYDHADDLGPIRPRLLGLRKTMAITSLGAPWWVDRLVMRRPVGRQFKTALLGTCAPQSSFEMLSIYRAERLATADVEQFRRRVERALRRW
ncbi:MAG TPA: NAD(P)H-dependent oxidoreductase [Rhodocyclaceae bacterium]